MQRDDWREDRRERPEGLVLQDGTCRFCGQMRQIETAAGWSQDEVDEAVTETCRCPSAEKYRHEKKIKRKGHEAVNRMYSGLPEEVVEILDNAVDLIAEGEIKTITVEARRKVKAKISATAKGGIKVERVENQKETEEI